MFMPLSMVVWLQTTVTYLLGRARRDRARPSHGGIRARPVRSRGRRSTRGRVGGQNRPHQRPPQLRVRHRHRQNQVTPPRPGRVRKPRSERGQAVVELALTFPLVVLLLLAIVQVGLIVRDQILVVHASREAARAGAVSADADAPRRAAVGSSELDPRRLSVDVGSRGEPGSTLRVVIRYRAPTEVPLLGALLPDVVLRAASTMRVEL